MGRIDPVLTEENEKRLRSRIKKKGDLSRIINQALDEYFKKEKKQR